jgi:vitamin B12 transporter
MRKRLITSLVLLAGSAAQAAAPPEITVTATGAPTALARVPGSVVVRDRATWERFGTPLLADALATVPGLALVQAGGPGAQSSAFLRGADSDHVLLLIDGVPLNDASIPGAAFNFGDDSLSGFDRAEIVFGPVSTLYGSNALGGVISFTTRLGGESPFVPRAAVQGGSHDTWRVEAGARGTLGRLDYAASAERFETGGESAVPKRIAPNGDADGAKITTGAAHLRARVSETVAIEGFVRVRENRFDIDGTASDDPNATGRARALTWRAATTGSFLDARLSTTLSIAETDTRREFVNPPNAPGGSVQDDDYWSKRRFIDASARYALTPQTILLAGAQGTRDRVEQRTATLGGFSFRQNVNARQNAWAAFAQLQTRLLDRLDLVAGARREEPEGYGGKTVYRLGTQLALKPVPLSVYANVATGFNAPTLFDRFGTSSFGFRGNPNLKPESIRAVEIGLRSESVTLGEGLTGVATVSAYRSTVRDLIQTDFARNTTVNIGRARLKGVDASVTFDWRSLASLTLSYSHTDPRNRVTGARLLRRPTNAWNALLSISPVEKLTLAGQIKYVGKRDDVAYSNTGAFLGTRRVDGYTVADLSLRYAVTEIITLTADAKNLFDKDYEPANAFAGQGRTVLIGARASF